MPRSSIRRRASGGGCACWRTSPPWSRAAGDRHPRDRSARWSVRPPASGPERSRDRVRRRSRRGRAAVESARRRAAPRRGPRRRVRGRAAAEPPRDDDRRGDGAGAGRGRRRIADPEGRRHRAGDRRPMGRGRDARGARSRVPGRGLPAPRRADHRRRRREGRPRGGQGLDRSDRRDGRRGRRPGARRRRGGAPLHGREPRRHRDRSQRRVHDDRRAGRRDAGPRVRRRGARRGSRAAGGDPRRPRYRRRARALHGRHRSAPRSGRRGARRSRAAGLSVLAKRVVPCLDVKDGRVVKGVQFVNLRDAGDPVEAALAYDAQGADELVFLDITASHEARDIMLDVVRRTAEGIYMPLTVGGGLRSVEGFGSQCIVIAIDARRETVPPGGTLRWGVYTHGGRHPAGRDALDWAREAVALGAGEILLTSMDRDGTKDGYDLELTRAVSEAVSVPVIASGGAGSLEHLYEGLVEGCADAALAASIFHFGTHTVAEAKAYLSGRGVEVRSEA